METKKQVNLLLDPQSMARLNGGASRAGLSRSAYVAHLLAVVPASAQMEPPPARPRLPLQTRLVQRLTRFGGRAPLSVLVAPWRNAHTADELRDVITRGVEGELWSATLVQSPRGRPATIIHWPEMSAVPEPVPPVGSPAEVAS
jgi:hypothetical protein